VTSPRGHSQWENPLLDGNLSGVNETTTQQIPPQEPRRLVRVKEGRVLGGVAAGLGRYFNLDPIIFRIGAIVLVLVGGAGLVAYLAAWLLIPDEDARGEPAEGRNRWLVIGGVILLLCVSWPFLLGGGLLIAGFGIPLAVLVVAGVLVWWFVSGEGPAGSAGEVAKRAGLGLLILLVCGLVAIGGGWAAAAGGETVVAIAVIVAGAAILAGAFLRPVRWLILPAVSVALAAGIVSAAGLDLHGGVGDRDYRPTTAAELSDGYQLGVGQLVVDLRHADLPRGDVPLKVRLGIGETRVLVPKNVCVATDAQVGIGEVRTFDRHDGGIDVDVNDRPDSAPARTRLLLDADVGIGALRIGHSNADIDYAGAHFDFGPSPPGIVEQNSGCVA
jgi:phage shock protein PspC (stress-responsive transcriptional regulator)